MTNLKTHILPYLGDWIISTMTAGAIDNFIDYLSKSLVAAARAMGRSFMKSRHFPLHP